MSTSIKIAYVGANDPQLPALSDGSEYVVLQVAGAASGVTGIVTSLLPPLVKIAEDGQITPADFSALFTVLATDVHQPTLQKVLAVLPTVVPLVSGKFSYMQASMAAITLISAFSPQG